MVSVGFGLMTFMLAAGTNVKLQNTSNLLDAEDEIIYPFMVWAFF